jgi:hypothetical protein
MRFRPCIATADDFGRITPYLVKAVQEIASITGDFKPTHRLARLRREVFARAFHASDEICMTCMNEAQLKAMLSASAAAGVSTAGGAPGGQPASTEETDASTNSSTTSPGSPQPSAQAAAKLVVNGNNPAQWPLNQVWNDNLGALFSHDGISETIYSTSTVDVSTAGTTTIDYWALIPTSGHFLHATRAVVIPAPANQNVPAASSIPPAANDNSPLSSPSATGTDATSTAQ